jgi:hypothetical protein
MKFTTTKKILAVLSFVTLISAFVLYRAGVFDKYLTGKSYSIQSSPNGGAMNNKTDTLTPEKKDSAQKVYAEKLKNIREGKSVKKDTIESATWDPLYWSGSKSGPIIKPSDFKKQTVDSTKVLDSSQRKKIDSIMKSEGTKKAVIMPSTKSAPVFKPAPPEQNELVRLIKIYQGDSAGLRRALERYFKVRN